MTEFCGYPVGECVCAEPSLNWKPVAELPKEGRILAICWYPGVGQLNLAGTWSHPSTFDWDPVNNYWGNRRAGTCIRESYQDKFMGIPIPDSPPPRS